MLSAVFFIERNLDVRLFHLENIIHHGNIIFHHMDQMLRISRILWLHIAGIHSGKKKLRISVLQDDLHDLLSQFPVDDMLVDDLTLVHDQRTVFTDIGDLILHAMEQTVKIRILPAAGCRENPSLLGQLMDQLCSTGI